MRTLAAGTLCFLLTTFAWAAPPGVCPDGRININEAPADTLTQLKGVGAKKAAAIVANRAEGGAFPSVDALTRVKGVGVKSVAAWSAQITTDCAAPAAVGKAPGPIDAAAPVGKLPGPIDLNTATAAQLTTLKGIGQKTAEAIVAAREAKGGFKALDELKSVKGIGDAKFNAIKDSLIIAPSQPAP